MAYILPQVRVFQEFQQAAVKTQSHNPFVFGPHYFISRNASIGAYNKDVDISYDYPLLPADAVVDLGWFNLYLTDVLAEYASIPESGTNPLQVVSDTERNKLRAAPRINNAELVDADSVLIVNGGFFTGGVALPEKYYFYPTGGWTGSAWESTGYIADLDADEDAKFAYITTEDLVGTMDILASENPLVAGSILQGPSGIVFNFSPGARTTLRAPRIFRVSNAGGTAYFDVSPLSSKIKDIIDAMIDNSAAYTFKATINATGPLAVDFSTTTLALEITVQNDTDDLTAVRAAIIAALDVIDYFTVGAITGTATELVTKVMDEAGATITDATAFPVIPDAYRIFIQANDYIFATGNGINNSYHFKTRGVEVGDRIAWEFSEGGIAYTGMSKIVGFEADMSRASIAQPTMGADNKATVTASSLSFKTKLDIVTHGTDNQRVFDGANTGVFEVSPIHKTYPGEYINGILEENILITITAEGAAGTAKATVTSEYGTYNRTNVPIMALTGLASDEAAIYIGRNLWVKFDKGAGDIDAIFKVGDTYLFSSTVKTGFTTMSASLITASGSYVGTQDTTYIIEVIRGGAFNRDVHAIDGLQNASHCHVTSITTPAATIDGVAISSTDAADFVADINASLAAAYAVLDGSNVIIFAAASVIAGIGTTSGGTFTKATATLTPSVDFANYWLLDVDDEYVLKCTKAGSILTAEFALESQRGDTQATVMFGGSGSGYSVVVGAQGLSLYFTIVGAVTFAIGDYWVVLVNGSRPQVRITDSLGSDQGSLVTVEDGVEISLGLNGAKTLFTTNTNTCGGFVTGGGLVKGDIFYVEAVASAASALKTLVLADDLPVEAISGQSVVGGAYVTNMDPSLFAAKLYLVQATTVIDSKKVQSPPDFNWIAAASNFTVNKSIAIQDTSWIEPDGTMPWLPVYSANIYINYRALSSDYADTIYSISDIGDVVTELGEISVDNPLAQGVYDALLNCGDKSVYFMGTPTNDLAGYLNVLDRATLNEVIYAFTPLTQDMDVIQAVKAHCLSMSTEEEKKWRIAFVGTALPTLKAIYTKATCPTGIEYKATVSQDPLVLTPCYTILTILTITAGVPTAVTDVNVGDKVYINFSTDAWGTAVYTECEVAAIVSNTVLKLKDSLAAPVGTATKIEVWHPYSVAEIATAVAAVSSGFASRRVYHVFPSVGYNGTTLLPSQYAAAGMSALCCSVLPQQGLTNVEFNGFTDLPLIYRTFNKDQLNEMAGSGTLILMQSAPGARIYVRHQVSTAILDGNLNTTELSMVKNLDSISYFFTDMLTPYIGRYNVTPELLDTLEVNIGNGLQVLGSFTGSVSVSPQVILANGNTKIVSLAQHATLRDHVTCVINLELPAPFNVLELHLVV